MLCSCRQTCRDKPLAKWKADAFTVLRVLTLRRPTNYRRQQQTETTPGRIAGGAASASDGPKADSEESYTYTSSEASEEEECEDADEDRRVAKPASIQEQSSGDRGSGRGRASGGPAVAAQAAVAANGAVANSNSCEAQGNQLFTIVHIDPSADLEECSKDIRSLRAGLAVVSNYLSARSTKGTPNFKAPTITRTV